MIIKPVEIFHTPASMDEVVEWCNSHDPDTRVHLLTAAFMTWNYLAAVAASNPEAELEAQP